MCTGKIENGYILKTWWKKTIKYTFIKGLSKLNYLVNRWRTEKLVDTHWTHKFFSVFTVNLFTCSRRKLITKTFLVCSTQKFVVNPYSPNEHTFLFDWFENKHRDRRCCGWNQIAGKVVKFQVPRSWCFLKLTLQVFSNQHTLFGRWLSANPSGYFMKISSLKSPCKNAVILRRTAWFS